MIMDDWSKRHESCAVFARNVVPDWLQSNREYLPEMYFLTVEAAVKATEMPIAHAAVSDVTFVAVTEKVGLIGVRCSSKKKNSSLSLHVGIPPTKGTGPLACWKVELFQINYIIFSLLDLIDLDEWLNTQKHLFRRPKRCRFPLPTCINFRLRLLEKSMRSYIQPIQKGLIFPAMATLAVLASEVPLSEAEVLKVEVVEAVTVPFAAVVAVLLAPPAPEVVDVTVLVELEAPLLPVVEADATQLALKNT